MANKIDLDHKREVSKETAKALADEKNIFYFETSAKDNIGIREAFDFIAEKVKMHIQKKKKIYQLKDLNQMQMVI